MKSSLENADVAMFKLPHKSELTSYKTRIELGVKITLLYENNKNLLCVTIKVESYTVMPIKF